MKRLEVRKQTALYKNVINLLLFIQTLSATIVVCSDVSPARVACGTRAASEHAPAPWHRAQHDQLGRASAVGEQCAAAGRRAHLGGPATGQRL